MSPITMPSIPFREQLLRSRRLFIDRIALESETRFTLSTPMDSKLICMLGLSNNARPKVFADPAGLIRLVDSWGLPVVAIPLDADRSTTEISETAREKIEKVMRSPRTRARRGANHRNYAFPQEWGPITEAVGLGHSEKQIAEGTGIPLATIRFVLSQLRQEPVRLSG